MHIPSHPVHTAAHCNPLQPTAKHPVHIQCTHCSSHNIFSAHCSHVQPCTAICSQSSVHTAAMYTHLQLSAANLQCTLQPTAAIYNHLHCNYSIQCTMQLYYLVHTAAILSSAHCSYSIQCTLQLYYPVHTAATLSIQYIRCTFEPPQGKLIPLAYLQSSQQTIMVDCSSP